ncbi:LrgB family protein [Laribacter hongkongensis]|uniref:LrgB family protein n=1 Tax=Laribacter hongkongensis TaxID=168471 RepID=A0ABD4SLK5_9NEIS|nr:LrgB family protein [Laribacter hongkongensis]MCG8992014.1 LrgB family protein [Laribacter hongkongensis]MCG8997907.1 LrgB family protein [Laribacter hongkongensis]MCG9000952.1 LrgB family protein [Laribacter hongkongensis]MCG9002949.1 LrgB family protein [Laribacter hongkongensis]MCG9006390.1 LrgB family protein [Laribacter hongkongensis]
MSALDFGVLSVLLTLGFYFLNKRLYRRYPKVWLAPLVLTPLALLAVVISVQIPYADYAGSTHWLVWLLGPATLAFALPLYEYRQLMRRHVLSLTVGTLVAVSTGVGGSVLLARWLDLPVLLQKSLMARSITTPFALAAAHSIGGSADLTGLFVILTGVTGMVLGRAVLGCLPVRSAIARGAAFGGASHAAGTARAREIGETEGVVSSLVMMIGGALTVLVAPLVAGWLW